MWIKKESEASIDLEISREEFKTIVNKKEKYEKMKGDITMTMNTFAIKR